MKVLEFPKGEHKDEWANTTVKSANDQIDWKRSIVIGENKDGNGHIYVCDFDDHAFLARALFQLEKSVKELITGIE